MGSRACLRRVFQVTLLLGIAAACGGCGASSGTVNGTVTFKGQPLSGGSVMFLDAAGVIHQAPIDASGKYNVTGLALGNAKIAVGYVDERVNEYARAVASGVRGSNGPPAPPPPLDMSTVLVLPPQYADHNSSGLSKLVIKGANTYDIVLVESAAPAP